MHRPIIFLSSSSTTRYLRGPYSISTPTTSSLLITHPVVAEILHLRPDLMVEQLSLDDIAELFEDIVVTITDTTKLEDDNHHPYISYSVHLYSPRFSWTVQKRYNDFLHLHEHVTHMEVENMQREFISLLNFDFPAKHFLNSRNIVNERKEAFVKYLEKSLKVIDLHSALAEFFAVREHVSHKDLLTTYDAVAANSLATLNPPPASTRSLVFQYKNNYDSSKSFRKIIKPHRREKEIELRRASSILTDSSASLLYSFLPAIVHTETFQLAYATHRDGWSLSTLYDKIDRRGPCIVLIKSMQCDDVVGAYVNAPLGPPSMTSRGDGSCFVFSLFGTPQCRSAFRQNKKASLEHTEVLSGDGSGVSDSGNGGGITESPHQPRAAVRNGLYDISDSDGDGDSDGEEEDVEGVKYCSAVSNSILAGTDEMLESASQSAHSDGKHIDCNDKDTGDVTNGCNGDAAANSDGNDDDVKIEKQSEPEGLMTNLEDIKREAILTQFAVASRHYLSFGGSRQTGSTAIHLDGDLLHCSTGPSDTYSNPRLTSEGVSDPFQVAEVEIFCGGSGMMVGGGSGMAGGR
jgi:hypothetical protein